MNYSKVKERFKKAYIDPDEPIAVGIGRDMVESEDGETVLLVIVQSDDEDTRNEKLDELIDTLPSSFEGVRICIRGREVARPRY